MKKTLLIATILIVLGGCKKDEQNCPQLEKRHIEFSFTCEKEYKIEVLFDQQRHNLQKDSGESKIVIDYEERNPADPIHYYQVQITTTHDKFVEIRYNFENGAKSGVFSMKGPGVKSNQITFLLLNK
jgi:hypothetical protein